MTYNVVTNIHAAHKLFVTTLMESFIILDTTSKILRFFGRGVQNDSSLLPYKI